MRVVLARPQDARNIGSVCRAMKTMGLNHLVIVAAAEPDWDEARKPAVGAVDILEGARLVDRLEEALSGCSLAAGITRRRGQKRKIVSFTARQFGEWAAASGGAHVSIVFGNETSGLSDDELSCCHLAVHIPSAPEFPSLNLSHAVQLLAYEIRQAALGRADVRIHHRPIDTETLDTLVADIVGAVNSLGFRTQEGPQGARVFLRDILARAELSPTESRRIRGLFHTLQGMHGRRGG